MCPADLRHRIKIQVRSQVADGQGGFQETWADHLSVWSNIKPVSATERFFSQKLEQNITHKITIRFNSTINSAMRVLYQGRVFKIEGAFDPDERKRWLQLNCEEGSGS